MNVLSYGRPFGTPGDPLAYYQSARGHAVRTVSYEGPADYPTAPGQTVRAVIDGMGSAWRPDLMLCWCPELVPPPLEIEQSPIPVVAVVSDWTVYGPQLEHNLARYDAVVLDKLGVERFRPYGTTPHYVGPIYAHRSGVHRDLGLERDIDIAFAGNLNHAVHIKRGGYVERVARLSDRYGVVIASELDAAAYTEVLNRARIVFNCSLRQEMNLRCFETLACGALLFIEDGNLEVGDWLAEGVEVVRYREDNLEALLAERLADTEGTAAMAARGHAALEQLSGEARLDDFIDAVAALPISGRPFTTLPPRDRAMAEILQYASSSLPGHEAHVARSIDAARESWPVDASFQMAAAGLALGQIDTLTGSARDAALRGVLDALRECATANPAGVVGWLNLAFVSKLAGAATVERRFLEFALGAGEVVHSALLMGARMDPYYQRWREALAFGNPEIKILHAGAACRLAELHLDAGDAATAHDFAVRAIALAPEIALAHRVLGLAMLNMGRATEAAEVLEQGLPLTSFDSIHRNALIDALLAMGKKSEARDLAEGSAAIFGAWHAAAHVGQAFRVRAGEIKDFSHRELREEGV